MDLHQFLSTVSNSAAHDWHAIKGNATLYRGQVVTAKHGDTSIVAVERVDWLATYKPDIDISLGTGVEHADPFAEPWSMRFPDKHARSDYLDFFYRGALVHREIVVDVDGMRTTLPLPDATACTVLADVHKRARLVADILGNLALFDEYFQRAGLTIG